MSLEALEGHPWILYAALLISIMVMIAQAIPKVGGSISKALADWASSQRAASADADDADIAERDREIAYIKGIAAERLRELRAFHDLANEHRPWDIHHFDKALSSDPNAKPPPPLIPIPKSAPTKADLPDNEN